MYKSYQQREIIKNLASPRKREGWSVLLKHLVWLVYIFGMSLHSEPGKKIITLRSSPMPLYEQALNGFRNMLKTKKTVCIIQDYTLPETEAEIDAMLKDIGGQAPDLLLTLGSSATRLAREKLKTVPQIFCMVVDPSSINLNSGGVSFDVKPADQIQYIRQHFPQLRRIGVIYNPQKNKESIRELKELKQNKNIDLIFSEVNNLEELAKAVSGLGAVADCLLMVSDPTLYSAKTMAQIILQTMQQGVPIIAISPSFAKVGALLGIYADYENNGGLAGEMAVRVLQGEKPSNLPVSWPTDFNTTLNQVVADRLKIKFNPTAIREAEQVIQ